MEFRKMVTITLCTRQQKRHWCIEQSFGLCGRGRGWDNLGVWHWNMYNIIYETSHQSRFIARYWMLGAGALGRPRGMVWGGRREEGSGWGTHIYLWQIHFDTWWNQYNIVKLNKIKFLKNISFSIKKNPTNEKYSRSEKWLYTDIVFILNEENKLQYLKWFILRNLTERSVLQKKHKILNQIITQISGLK